MSLGHYTATLAKALNANYYSNEIYGLENLDEETRVNFAISKQYTVQDEEINPALKEWIDILSENVKENDLVIYLGSAAASREPFANILCGGKKGVESFKDIENPTINNIEKIEKFYEIYADKLNSLNMLPITGHSEFGNTNNNHIMQVLRNKNKAESISIILSDKILMYATLEDYYATIRILADSIKESLV